MVDVMWPGGRRRRRPPQRSLGYMTDVELLTHVVGWMRDAVGRQSHLGAPRRYITSGCAGADASGLAYSPVRLDGCISID